MMRLDNGKLGLELTLVVTSKVDVDDEWTLQLLHRSHGLGLTFLVASQADVHAEWILQLSSIVYNVGVGLLAVSLRLMALQLLWQLSACSICLDTLVVLHGFYSRGSNYGYDFKVKDASFIWTFSFVVHVFYCRCSNYGYDFMLKALQSVPCVQGFLKHSLSKLGFQRD